MTRKFFLIFTLLCSVFSLNSFAEVWTAETLPIPYLKDAHQYVSNPEHIISPAIQDSINSIFYELEQKKGVQTLVVVVKRIKNGDAYDFAMELGKKHGIGSKKQNSGLIILLSTKDRSYEILTGRGLEGTLPDAICKRIENLYMVPSLKKGDWDAAMYLTAKGIQNYIIGDKSLFSEKKESAKNDGSLAALIISILIIIFLISAGRRNRNKSCPRCKKNTLKAVKTEHLRLNTGKRIRRVTYHCSNCNYMEVRDEDENDHNGMGMLLPFLFLGGMGGTGQRGGGGFGGGSGGSFGGGSFGGGGAGGNF